MTNATIHSESRNIIRNVVDFFDTEKKTKTYLFNIDQSTEKAAAATGKSVSFISKIRKESLVAGDTPLKSPKKLKSGRSKKIVLDHFDLGVLRRTVQEVYTVDKCIPTLNILLNKMREKINFEGHKETLRKYLKQIGFSYQKCQSKRKVLMERNDIIAWRSRYLRRIRVNDALGLQKKPVTYLDETYVHTNYSVSNCWQSEDVQGVLKNEGAGQRYIIVHAGGSYGFVEGALLIYKSKSKKGDYHDDMNHDNFIKWLKEKLIPNLPKNGIVVMDNASYHSVQINKPPTSCNNKQEIINWLNCQGISTSNDLRKAELLEIVKSIKQTKSYYVDELLKSHGHEVLRLPPYHCELSPIELIWSRVKHNVAMNNISQNNANMENIIKEAFKEITVDLWQKECDHTKKIEEEMWIKDGLMDEAIDEIIIPINNSDSSDISSEEEDDDEC